MLSTKENVFIFDPSQVLPLGARVDLGVMSMKGYSTFSKATIYWSNRTVSYLKWPRVVALDSVLSMGQIELFQKPFDHLTVSKQITDV